MTIMKILAAHLLTASVLCAQQFAPVDSIINSSIGSKIFPGASIIIGTGNKILYLKSYGHFTYDPDSAPVTDNSMYDLASLTKVFATTMCMMKLVDDGKIDLNADVAHYIPDFGENGKSEVKIKNLLLHNSGLKAYYTPKAGESRTEILDKILGLHPSYPTGSKTVYSCLNMVSAMEVIEAVTHMPMYKYYEQNFTGPLKMSRTMFNPVDSLKKECLPALPGLQGVVHDPLARGLDGLSGNAGLFSAPEDLAKICQLLLNLGTYNGTRYLKDSTVKEFLTCDSSAGSRALGWDTNELGGTSAGSLFSPSSFGHTGYTGTSVWCDPVNNIFVVFLTNRVYPDDKASVGQTRIEVNSAAFKAAKEIRND